MGEGVLFQCSLPSRRCRVGGGRVAIRRPRCPRAARRARERNGITGRRSDGLGLWGLASRVAIDDWASRGIGRPGNGPIGSTSESWALFLVENGLQTYEIEASYTTIY